MKSFTRICLSLLITFSATSLQAQSAKTPIEFNDELTAVTDSLVAYGQGWGGQFNKATKSRSGEVITPYSTLAPYRKSMELFVDRTIGQLKVKKDVKNSRELRTAMIHFMEYEKKMISMAFKPLEQLKSSATNAELQAALDQLKIYSKDEQAELAKVATAQGAYARSNGFTIESADEARKP